MAEQSIMTTPAAPRPARLKADETRTSTSEFLRKSDLASVFVSYKRSYFTPQTAAVTDQEGQTSSKNETEIAVRVESKRKRILRLTEAGREYYAMLKKYDGVVLSRDDESFVAQLYESPSDYPMMEAEFAVSDVAESEREFLVEGARLVWTISYRHEGNTRSRDSTLYLRRSTWSAQDLAAAEQRASALTNAINWHRPSTGER